MITVDCLLTNDYRHPESKMKSCSQVGIGNTVISAIVTQLHSIIYI